MKKLIFPLVVLPVLAFSAQRFDTISRTSQIPTAEEMTNVALRVNALELRPIGSGSNNLWTVAEDGALIPDGTGSSSYWVMNLDGSVTPQW